MTNKPKSDLTNLIEANATNADIIKNTTAYCVMPWSHLHVATTGDVLPCCIADWQHSLGNLNDMTYDEIWNGEKMREFRRSMADDKKHKSCKSCYEKEATGSWSQRIDGINKFQKTVAPWVLNTESDGTSTDSKPIYWDIRFSNICNMRCRMCGHFASSRWFADAKKLEKDYNDNKYLTGDSSKAIMHSVSDSQGLLDRLEEYLPHVEELYFAGGEPLIMDEHYRIIEYLHTNKLFKTKIRYSTNLAKLIYKRKDIVELWKDFEWVECVASLDATGKRAEILRKDTVWQDILDNSYRIKKEAPNVWFRIAPTVQILSIIKLPELHKEFLTRGLLGPNDCFYNILSTPQHHNIQALPPELKQTVREIWTEYRDWLTTTYNPAKLHTVLGTIDHTLTFMDAQQLPDHHLYAFVKKTKALDNIRNEDTPSAFPELNFIWNNYS
jgi:radical SAM protein with 4Fe4S-binding SPASM domain